MNGIVINIDPTIVHVGMLELRWYGLLFVFAVLAGSWLGIREPARRGFDAERVQSLALWSLLGALVGARLFHVIDRWDLYANNPWAILDFRVGLAIYGGLAGGILTGVLYARRHHMPVWKLADAVAPGILLGQALGRLACIVDGDSYGAPANLPWAFIYTNPMAMLPAELRGVPTHPYPVYELLFDLALLGVLWRLRPRFKIAGSLFLTYAAVYAAGRFLLTFYRMERIWFWGLQEAQVAALIALAVALPLLLWKLQAGKPRRPDTAATQAKAQPAVGVS